MTNLQSIFEVEIRCRFSEPDEAFAVLPFLAPCLGREISWVTRYYGEALFRSGQLLRMTEVNEHGKMGYYLGWKGRDTGVFANIRLEVDEEITVGVTNSPVIRRLGGSVGRLTTANVTQELQRLGHREFMSFRGSDLTGYDEQLDLKVKLMTCPTLKWPLLVELEKTAYSEQEAIRCERELLELSRGLQLQDRLVKEEPPTLLYEGQSRQSPWRNS
ncbi:MAG: hypothetical protein A2147_07940 [Chloroflexi bacterium RBG_16_57_8]|nr:MAG: hypothetical protein A2147_07940 [Chloroflexi bacterium RBG_16_57_8]